MKPIRLLRVSVTTLAAVLALTVAQRCGAQSPTITDLGGLGTNEFNVATGLNDSGLIAGYSMYLDTNGNSIATALVWAPGTTNPTALPLPGSNYPYSVAGVGGFGRSSVNASGLILGAGYYFNQNGNEIDQGCVWKQQGSNWVVTGLGFMPGTTYDFSTPSAINAAGQVVGMTGVATTADRSGFIWDSTNGMQGFTNLPYPGTTIEPRAGISDNGYVAGLLSSNGIGSSGVIWDSASKTTIGFFSNGVAEAISPGGLVAGYDSAQPKSGISFDRYLFLWRYTNGTGVEVNLGQPSILPPDGLTTNDLQGIEVHATAVNDNGQIVGYGFAYWASYGQTTFYWKWDGSQFIDLLGVLPTNTPPIGLIYPIINSSGQVLLDLFLEDGTYLAYLWDGNTSHQAVALPGLGGATFGYCFNNSGQIPGTAFNPFDSRFHACAWGLAGPQSALTLSSATLAARNSKIITVTLMITNSNATTANNVTVTSARLDGSNTTMGLPLTFGTIKPGASKKCTLQFKNVPAGQQTLTVTGTSSLGNFFTTQTLTVP